VVLDLALNDVGQLGAEFGLREARRGTGRDLCAEPGQKLWELACGGFGTRWARLELERGVAGGEGGGDGGREALPEALGEVEDLLAHLAAAGNVHLGESLSSG